MVMETTNKSDILKTYQKHEKDTGSAGVQIALLTSRIDKLTDHLKANKKDCNSRYGLIKMVSARRRLLDYLQRVSETGYQDLIKQLKLRR